MIVALKSLLIWMRTTLCKMVPSPLSQLHWVTPLMKLFHGPLRHELYSCTRLIDVHMLILLEIELFLSVGSDLFITVANTLYCVCGDHPSSRS